MIGHLKVVNRIFSSRILKGKITVDTTYPNHSIYPTIDHLNSKQCHPEAEDKLPSYLKETKSQNDYFLEADHTGFGV